MLTRLRLAWLTAADARPERTAALLLAAAAAALVWKGPQLPEVLVVLLAAAVVVAAGVLLRRAWRWLLGPMFYYDVLASSRRGRNIGLRCVYAVALLGAVFLVYASWFGAGSFGRPLPPGDLARFGAKFFAAFMAAQFIAVLVLTPIFTAGAIADERERRRLDFLLVTELQNREIVCGKLAARVAAVALLLLTGLPILALLQFLGGVEPLLLLIGFLATFITLVSVAAVGMGVSAMCEKASNAMWLTYLVILGYLAAGWCPPILNWGHPGVLAEHLEIALAADRLDVLAKCVAMYAAAHAFIAVTAVLGAMHGLRPAIDHGPLRRFAPAEVKLPPLPAAPPADPFDRQPPPPVGDRPLLWKELYVAQERSTPAARGLLFMLAAGISLLVGFQCVLLVVDALDRGEPVGAVLNPMVRGVGDLLACILLMGIALTAVGTVAREREQQTLDSLLTLPVERIDILWAKWLGSVLSVRRLMVLAACVWLFGVATGAIHAVTVLPLTAALAAYAAFAAGLGLVYSVISATKVQAMLRTMVTLLLVLVASVALDPRFAMTTPPAVFWTLAFEPQYLDGYHAPYYYRYHYSHTEAEDITWALIGVAAYGLFAPFLWFWSRDAFVKEGAKA